MIVTLVDNDEDHIVGLPKRVGRRPRKDCMGIFRIFSPYLLPTFLIQERPPKKLKPYWSEGSWGNVRNL